MVRVGVVTRGRTINVVVIIVANAVVAKKETLWIVFL